MTGQNIQDLGVFAVGEVPETLIVTLKGTDGNAIDLTSFTPKMAITAIEGTAAAGLASGAISKGSPETDGTVEYIWDADDFAAAGLFRLQIWADDGTNTIASEIFQYAVESVTTAPSFP